MKVHFCQFIFIDRYLKFKEIEYFSHYIKSETWPAFFYVSFPYFQQSHSNWNIAFFNSNLDLKLWFVNVDVMLYFRHFPNSQKDWKLGYVNGALVGLLNFFPIHKGDGLLEFLNN